MQKTRGGFTLIELLVVIAIIGLIATLSVIALNNARAKSRDAKRAADIKQIQTALELYFNDVGRYPENLDFGGALFSTSTSGTTTYMAKLPTAPTPPDGACTSGNNNYSYYYLSNGSNYGIEFCLGGGVASVSNGSVCATAAGVINRDCCSSFPVAYTGGPYDANGVSTTTGGYYRAVKVGDQCWLKDNLNVGQMIYSCSNDGGVSPAACDGLGNRQYQDDDNVIEKYCYNDNEINPDPSANYGCDTGSSFYQWSEAMALPSSCDSADCSAQISANHQGLCPAGWHIPSDSDWHAIEYYLSAEPKCDSTHSNNNCVSAGNKMIKRLNNPYVGSNGCYVFDADCGSSGLDILTGGYIESDGRSYYASWYTKYLSATQTNDNQMTGRMFDRYQTGLYYYDNYPKIQGFLVRCVKN